MMTVATEGQARKFRILSLDGGGIKGTYTASVLATLETMTHKSIVDYFDLITGTSTGGIIAVGLGLGLSANQILDFYISKGPDLFPPAPRGYIRKAYRRLMGPKLSQEKLFNALQEVVGDRQFGESKCRLVIPAFDGVQGSIHLFKTAHTCDYKLDYLKPAKTVAMGTAAAPTYYPAYTDELGAAYLDGGVWAISPVMIGLLEATCVLNHNIEDVEILSIGTTTEPFNVTHPRRRGGVAAWNIGLIKLILHAQAEAALAQAKLMTKNRMLRIDATTTPGRFTMDNAAEINDLCSLGVLAARKHEIEVSSRFLFAPADKFRPFYSADVKTD